MKGRNMGGRGRVLRALFGVLLLVGFIWFLFVGILANQATKTTTIIFPSAENFKHSKLTGRQRPAAYQDLNLNYVSKRRVPNGPDPIHNRAGKSRQPPDQA